MSDPKKISELKTKLKQKLYTKKVGRMSQETKEDMLNKACEKANISKEQLENLLKGKK